MEFEGALQVPSAVCNSIQWRPLAILHRRLFVRNFPVSRKLHNSIFLTAFNDTKLPPRTLRSVQANEEFRNSSNQIDMDNAYIEDKNVREQGMELTEEAYIGLFVRRLGMDNLPEDREEAVRALWRYSMGGREKVDQIVAFPGVLTLVVSLLPSQRLASSEAAAGLLRNIISYEMYKTAVTEVGAVEEIIGLLTRRSLSEKVREQAAGCLCNLSSEDSVRDKIDISELLPALLTMLGSEGSIKESAIGILANFSLNENTHALFVEAGIIPKLANLFKSAEGSKVMRQEARKILLQLVHKDPYKQIIIEEGLVPVPLIGANAYQSFKPLLDVAPSLPEGVELKTSSLPTTFGAGNLLLGLNGENKSLDLDEATQMAIDGRARQHFLGRIGLLGKEEKEKEEKKHEYGDSHKREKLTIMPWYDGIPRLILILGLEDVSVASTAARTISDISINEEIRQLLYKAGCVPHLIRLLCSGDEVATETAASAIEKLAVSFQVRKSIDVHGAVPALVEVLKARDAPDFVKEKVLSALDRLSQTGEEVKAMIQSGAHPGLMSIAQSESSDANVKAEIEGILEELSSRKEDSRDKIVNANGIPALVELLSSGTLTLKLKAAHVLENLATRQQHAESIVSLGIMDHLKSVLEVIPEGNEVSGAQDIAVRQDIWDTIAAAARLLSKLVEHEKVRSSIDCKRLAYQLKNVLKSSVSLDVKDWVSACLLKLDRAVGITTNMSLPIESEVIIHDRIPRLVSEIVDSLYPDIQERAAVELHDIVSQGVEDYAAAIANSGGIFPLVELLENGTAKAREAALPVLYSISTNEENHPALIRAGIVNCLERIIKSGSSQWMLALYILRALPT